MLYIRVATKLIIRQNCKRGQMNSLLRATVILLYIILFFSANCIPAQTKTESDTPYIYLLGRHLTQDEIFVPEHINKKPGRYTQTDWAQLIDQTWGIGLFTSQKLALFDRAWQLLDEGYGAFVNRDVDMDSLKNLYRPMIEAGVSRGKFAAIMNHLSLAMQDAHTFITSIPVTWGTQALPGVPLFVVSAARDNSRFGATLTVLPDSTLLVIKARTNHKLGLVPGDIVLGYDGAPWSDLYKELLEAMLPIQMNYVFGSTDESLRDVFLRSAGLNWHLFDTIDIKKYSTGEVVHLSTAPLINQTGAIWGNEQLEIPGVPQPDFAGTDHITWGIIDGTRIGYICAASWDYRAEYNISADFYDAVYNLQMLNNTSGLIIDMRLNYGGDMRQADEGYALLFNQYIYHIGFDKRNDINNHFSMNSAPTHSSSFWVVRGDPDTYYDRPIAVLTGPGAVSNGDWESMRLGWHPMARVFGRPTNGAYTISDYPDLQNDDWFFYRAFGSGYLFEGHTYMAHTSAPIDEEVWFAPDDVANGHDTVVDAAIEWINQTTTGVEDNIETPTGFALEQNYPNPFNPSTTISYTIPATAVGTSHDLSVRLTIINILGQTVATLVNEQQSPGTYNVMFDASTLPSGVYFYQLVCNNVILTKKMMLIK